MTLHRADHENFGEFFNYGSVTLGRRLSIEEFTELAEKFPDLQMEREKTGKTTIMSPVKQGSGEFEMIVSGYVFMWNLKEKKGKCFSASTGIQFPDGKIKSPDASWVSYERLEKQTATQKKGWLQVTPNFVAEVRSSTDSLLILKRKMKNVWMANGVELGWLIDPRNEKVYIYRAEKEVEVLQGFKSKTLSGENVMLGMTMPLDDFIG